MPERRTVFSPCGATGQFKSGGVSRSDSLNIIPSTALIVSWRDGSCPHVHHSMGQAGVISLPSAQTSRCRSETCNLQSRGWGQWMFSWGAALNHSDERAKPFLILARRAFGLGCRTGYGLKTAPKSCKVLSPSTEHLALTSFTGG